MKNRMLSLAVIIASVLICISNVFADEKPLDLWQYELPEVLASGEDITVLAKGQEDECTLILALYKSDRMVNLSVKECKDADKSVKLTLPDDFSALDDWSFKAFIWNSLSGMKPLEQSLEIDIDMDITDKFEDEKFLQAVREITGKNDGESIYKSDVKNIEKLELIKKIYKVLMELSILRI